MSNCMNCGEILNERVKLISLLLQRYNIQKYTCQIIIKYSDYKVKALHDDHYICVDCISQMRYYANIQDTNWSNCPICSRNIIIGDVKK